MVVRLWTINTFSVLWTVIALHLDSLAIMSLPSLAPPYRHLIGSGIPRLRPVSRHGCLSEHFVLTPLPTVLLLRTLNIGCRPRTVTAFTSAYHFLSLPFFTIPLSARDDQLGGSR